LKKEEEKGSPNDTETIAKDEKSGDASSLGTPAANSAWPSPNLASLAASRAKLQGKTFKFYLFSVFRLFLLVQILQTEIETEEL
jgi:hypothetical protein